VGICRRGQGSKNDYEEKRRRRMCRERGPLISLSLSTAEQCREFTI
jgi:hypothetical protein